MTYDDYICGTKFRDMANYVLREGSTDLVHYPEREQGKYPILYSHTHDFASLAQATHKFGKEVVLITHNSDGEVKVRGGDSEFRSYDADASLLPDNVIKWYAQNVMLNWSITKIIPIPIGLENRYCFDYDKAEMVRDYRWKHMPYLDDGSFYLNCNVHTNFTERVEIYEICDKLPYVRINHGKNGDNYAQYLIDIRKSSMVISPRGNGLDCHRTWETLYLDRTPILFRHKGLTAWEMPIVFVDDWKELGDYDRLAQQQLDAINKFYPSKQLKFSYWKHRIIHENT